MMLARIMEIFVEIYCLILMSALQRVQLQLVGSAADWEHFNSPALDYSSRRYYLSFGTKLLMPGNAVTYTLSEVDSQTQLFTYQW
jgi:hypothetical protein